MSELNNTELSIRTQGDGDVAVLWIHGWMVTGSVFDAVLAAMGSSCPRSILPDLPGAGGSKALPGPYAVPRHVQAICSLIEGLDAKRLVVVGHSMGGQIAQLVAAQLGERIAGLAVINPVPVSGLPVPEEARALFLASVTDRDKRGVILDMACKQLDADGRERLLSLSDEVSEACLRESFESWSAGVASADLSTVTAPTLVVATDDPFLPPEFLTAQVVDPIAKARLARLSGPGHYPLTERPMETAAILSAFFAGVGV